MRRFQDYLVRFGLLSHLPNLLREALLQAWASESKLPWSPSVRDIVAEIARKMGGDGWIATLRSMPGKKDVCFWRKRGIEVIDMKHILLRKQQNIVLSGEYRVALKLAVFLKPITLRKEVSHQRAGFVQF